MKQRETVEAGVRKKRRRDLQGREGVILKDPEPHSRKLDSALTDFNSTSSHRSSIIPLSHRLDINIWVQMGTIA